MHSPVTFHHSVVKPKLLYLQLEHQREAWAKRLTDFLRVRLITGPVTFARVWSKQVKARLNEKGHEIDSASWWEEECALFLERSFGLPSLKTICHGWAGGNADYFSCNKYATFKTGVILYGLGNIQKSVKIIMLVSLQMILSIFPKTVNKNILLVYYLAH